MITNPERNTELCTRLQDAYLGEFPSERVVTLLGYGSMVDGRSTTSDIDVYMLLDDFRRDDVMHARNAAAQFPAEVELTLHYASEMPENPNRFRLGKKSCLALAYLASAELLHGENVPATMFNNLEPRVFRASALQLAFYYVGQMRKEMSSASIDSATMENRMNKYFSRFLVDSMLFYEKTTFEPFKYLMPQDVIDMARDHEKLGASFQNSTEQPDNLEKLELMHHIHNDLRIANWQMRRSEDMSERGKSIGWQYAREQPFIGNPS